MVHMKTVWVGKQTLQKKTKNCFPAGVSRMNASAQRVLHDALELASAANLYFLHCAITRRSFCFCTDFYFPLAWVRCTQVCVCMSSVSFIQVMCLFSMTWIFSRFIFFYLPYIYSHYYNYYPHQMYIIIHKCLVFKTVFEWLFPLFSLLSKENKS